MMGRLHIFLPLFYSEAKVKQKEGIEAQKLPNSTRHAQLCNGSLSMCFPCSYGKCGK